jgi:hypothetical protein
MSQVSLRSSARRRCRVTTPVYSGPMPVKRKPRPGCQTEPGLRWREAVEADPATPLNSSRRLSGSQSRFQRCRRSVKSTIGQSIIMKAKPPASSYGVVPSGNVLSPITKRVTKKADAEIAQANDSLVIRVDSEWPRVHICLLVRRRPIIKAAQRQGAKRI